MCKIVFSSEVSCSEVLEGYVMVSLGHLRFVGESL